MIEFRDNQWNTIEANPARRIEDRLPAFVPDLSAADSGLGRALLEIAERYTGILAASLSRAPSKAKLAFLDAIGVEPIPPQPARCPVVFELLPGTGNAQAPINTQVAAQGPDGEDVIFETESQIALATSRLVEIKAVLGEDRYVDHSLDVVGEKAVSLFSGIQPIPRELYLAHDRYFAVTPGALIELQVELAPISVLEQSPWNLQWEYWDGSGWTPFAPFPPLGAAAEYRNQNAVDDNSNFSHDGTRNLSRSGTIQLLASGKPAEQNTIRGIKSYWIRARVLPVDTNSGTQQPFASSKKFPEIDRIQSRAVSTVGGFRLARQTEKLRALKSQLVKSREEPSTTVRIRLVDDSGTPLAPPGYRIRFYKLATPDKVSDFKDYVGDSFTVTPLAFSADEERILVVQVKWGSGKGERVSPDIQIRIATPDRDYDIELARHGRLPAPAFGKGVSVDPTAAFQPFGPVPQPGATFLFACPEILSKPGARVTIFTEVADEYLNAPNRNDEGLPTVRWEYWNGTVWAPLADVEAQPDASGNASSASKKVLAFVSSGQIRFTVPQNVALKKMFGEEQLWIRAHLSTGSYLIPKGGIVKIEEPSQTVTFDKVFPPIISKFRLEYEYTSPSEAAAACLMRSDFRWTDKTTDAKFGGQAFVPFRSSDEIRPTLYLGFARALPTALISLFINVQSKRVEPDLSWEYYDGRSWRRLALEKDETAGFSRPGLVQFVWPGTPMLPDPEPLTVAEGKTLTFLDGRLAARFRKGDSIAVFQDEIAESCTVEAVTNGSLKLTTPLENKFTAASAGFSPLPRFGTPRHWVRVVWPRTDVPQPGDPDEIKLQGLFLNAVWAQQTESVQNEVLGTSGGLDGEEFDLTRRSVLEGERVQILELHGRLANAGWPALLEELKQSGSFAPDDLVLEHDEKSGDVIGAWVRWKGRPNFAGSNAKDRHYVLERTKGKLQFGDGYSGRVPPINPNNIRISYRSGGGQKGNVAAHSVRTVRSGVTVAQVVFNPIAASGGADGEMLSNASSAVVSAISERGPQLVRHRHRAVTAEDYEQLARAASPGVAAARVITPAGTRGVVRAGSIQVILLPHADVNEPEPKPSDELVRDVTTYLQRRAPAGLAGRVTVAAPTYFPVGIEIALVPVSADSAGQLYLLASRAIATYLHPVAGGPEGRGWGFGDAVHRSELVKWLHNNLDVKPLLSFVQEFRLLDRGVAVPEDLAVPFDQVPCAGVIRVLVNSSSEVCR